MQPEPMSASDDMLTVVKEAIAETNRRERGNFDGLLGNFDELSAPLLRDILTQLRDYLLDRYSDEEAHRLLTKFEPSQEFQWMPVISDDVVLAIDLLNRFRIAARCNDEQFAGLILGRAGVRDEKRQEGARKAGKTTGARKASEAAARYRAWRDEADKLIANGTASFNIAAKLAARYGVTASTIRRGLKKARTG